jgi:hypothetical protein
MIDFFVLKLERAKGFEPSTPTLARLGGIRTVNSRDARPRRSSAKPSDIYPSALHSPTGRPKAFRISTTIGFNCHRSKSEEIADGADNGDFC